MYILHKRKIYTQTSNIFNKRLNELHENLKLRENEGKNNYAILAFNPDRKIYYKKNIKKKWGIDANVINSIDNIRAFKSLIVPSELVQSKIIKLLIITIPEDNCLIFKPNAFSLHTTNICL